MPPRAHGERGSRARRGAALGEAERSLSPAAPAITGRPARQESAWASSRAKPRARAAVSVAPLRETPGAGRAPARDRARGRRGVRSPRGCGPPGERRPRPSRRRPTPAPWRARGGRSAALEARSSRYPRAPAGRARAPPTPVLAVQLAQGLPQLPPRRGRFGRHSLSPKPGDTRLWRASPNRPAARQRCPRAGRPPASCAAPPPAGHRASPPGAAAARCAPRRRPAAPRWGPALGPAAVRGAAAASLPAWLGEIPQPTSMGADSGDEARSGSSAAASTATTWPARRRRTIQ